MMLIFETGSEVFFLFYFKPEELILMRGAGLTEEPQTLYMAGLGEN